MIISQTLYLTSPSIFFELNLSKYRPLLESQESIKQIVENKKDISEWVTQKRNLQDFLTTFKHLVVRQAEIFCHFKDATTQQYIDDKIMLVDVPGMGDTRLGDEQLMLETIGKDVDAVLYLTRPDAKRFLWKENHKEFKLSGEISFGENDIRCLMN